MSDTFTNNLVASNALFGGFGSRKLAALCDATGLLDQKNRILGMFNELSAHCHDRELRLPPRWSGLTDDCTPFEFSVVFNNSQPTIRFAIEAQDDPASPETYWNAGMKLHDYIERNYQVDFTRFHQIKSLFIPTDPAALWAIWHGVDFRVDETPLFKLYLNPLAQGYERSNEIIFESLLRLGFTKLWPLLMAIRGPRDSFSQLSLDLTSDSQARVKVYIRHRNATFDELDVKRTLATGLQQHDWSSFCSMFADCDQLLSRRPVFGTYYATDQLSDYFQNVVLHVPAFPYAENDEIASQRIQKLLTNYEIPSSTYQRCAESLADGPLNQQQGLHNFVSFQRRKQQPQLTVYFGARAYYPRFGGLALDPARCWPSAV